MSGYVRVPVDTNPEDLVNDITSYIQAQFPQWQPNLANLDTWIIRAIANDAADLRTLASDVPDSIYMYFGSKIMGINPIQAISAYVDSTWTLIDNLGHTIPAGTTVGINDDFGNIYAFQTTQDITVAAGSSVTGAGAVRLLAVDPGTGPNGLSTVPSLIDVLDFVDSIALTDTVTGGVDDETTDDYLNRLTRIMQGISRRPILPADFANAALEADPTVARAVVLDGYDPGTNTYSHERTVTISAVDATGTGVDATVKSNIQTYIEDNREVNFIVNMMDPNYTEIDVAATVALMPGYAASDVEASVIATLQNYLSPAVWGTEPLSTQAQNTNVWNERETLYYNELIGVVANVQGVARVSDLTCNIHGDAAGRVDIALTAPASLTTAGTITCVAS